MILALFDATFLVIAAVFVAFTAGAWWLLDLVASRRTRAVERLSELKDPRKRLLERNAAKKATQWPRC